VGSLDGFVELRENDGSLAHAVPALDRVEYGCPLSQLKATQDSWTIMNGKDFNEPSSSPQSGVRILPCPGGLRRK
jgi:hypothetical protein